jgi:hypothetical protein
MVVGIESLVAACDMVKKRAFSPRGHRPFSPSFSKTYWSASFWKYRKWVAGNNAHRGKGHSVAQPHYQAPRPKTLWNRSPTVHMSRLTIHNSTGDTELTIDVGNLVAKIRKSNIIEPL